MKINYAHYLLEPDGWSSHCPMVLNWRRTPLPSPREASGCATDLTGREAARCAWCPVVCLTVLLNKELSRSKCQEQPPRGTSIDSFPILLSLQPRCGPGAMPSEQSGDSEMFPVLTGAPSPPLSPVRRATSALQGGGRRVTLFHTGLCLNLADDREICFISG